MCEDVGFDINPDRNIMPTPVIEFRGISVDSQHMELRISNDRLASMLNTLLLGKEEHDPTSKTFSL